MRVLQIIPRSLERKGGPLVYILELCRILQNYYNIKVDLLVMKKGYRNVGKIIQDSYENCKIYSIFSPSYDPWIYSTCINKVFDSLLKYYDIIHVHGPSIPMQIMLLKERLRKKSLILTMHGSIIHDNLEPLRHKFYIANLINLFTVTWRSELAFKLIAKNALRILFVSNHLKKIYLQRYPDYASKSVVVYNGVDTSVFKPIRYDNHDNKIIPSYNKVIDKFKEYKVILYVGRITPIKGVMNLIKAYATLPHKYVNDSIIVLVGDAEINYIKQIMSASMQLGIDKHVIYLGKVQREILPYIYSLSLVYVLPSYFEGLPTTILEAMACGVPVIASSVGGIPEVLIHNKTGLLIEPGDVKGLRNALELLLEDEKLRKKLASNSIKIVRNFFSLERLGERHIKIYNEVL